MGSRGQGVQQQQQGPEGKQGVLKDAEEMETELSRSSKRHDGGAGVGFRDDERVLHFFGTGSAVPSQLRNVTCMLLTRGIWVDAAGATTVRPGAASMLFDCGEGSLAQMQRKFGAAHLDAVLRSLRMVHISHMHADHHLGLTRVLAHRREAFARAGIQEPPVVVVAPLYLWLFSRFTAHLSMDNAVYLDAKWTRGVRKPLPGFVPAHVRAAYADACKHLQLSSLSSPFVRHCHAAYGLVLDFSDKFRLVWS